MAIRPSEKIEVRERESSDPPPRLHRQCTRGLAETTPFPRFDHGIHLNWAIFPYEGAATGFVLMASIAIILEANYLS
jgi:hypothetical protein